MREIPQQMLNGMANWGRGVGEYWAGSNAAFEKTDPGLASRVWRSLNPMTALGSSLGSMHTAAGAGDGVGTSLAAAESLPLFGTLKLGAKSLSPTARLMVPHWNRFTKDLGIGLGASMADDAYAQMRDYGKK